MRRLADRRQIAALFVHHGPVVLARDAEAAGISRSVLRRSADRGELTRLGKAAFVSTSIFEAASLWEAFRLRSIAFSLSSGPDTFLTGPAAAAVLEIPMVGDPPDHPTALRPGNAHVGHDRSPYGRVRHGYLPPSHQRRRGRAFTVSPAYCAVDIARHYGTRDGILAADRVLASGVHREVLANLVDNMSRYPGIESARWVVENADPRAESPLESLGRFAFLSEGLPAPVSNAWIPVAGQWFRADHLLPEQGVILEADGAVKYDNRVDAATLVRADRDRERLLRSLHFGIARYGWSLAMGKPSEIIRRAQEAARLRSGQPVPTCWTLTPPWAA